MIFFTIILLLSVMRTNAQGWNIVGTGANAFFANQGITSVCSDYFGNVYAAGNFYDDTPGQQYYVAKWNGSRWYGLGRYDTVAFDLLHGSPLFTTPITSLCTDRSGYLYAAGGVGFDSVYRSSVAKWDGVYWHKLGPGTNTLISGPYDITSMVTDSFNNLYVAGTFISGSTGVTDTFYLAKWDGTAWTLLDDQFQLSSLSIDPSNNLYASGGFVHEAGSPWCVARWDGMAWNPLGTGSHSLSVTSINSICTDYAGNIYAAVFQYASFTNYIVKWEDTAWYNLGFYANSNIMSMCSDKQNNLYIGGTFSVSALDSYSKFDVIKYDGTSFTPLGTPLRTTADTDFIYDISQDGFQSLCLDTAGNVYGALWMGKAHRFSDTAYLFADSFYVVRFGTPFAIDTTILPPPDTTDVPPVDTVIKTAIVKSASEIISVYPIPTRDVINIDMDKAIPGTRCYIFNTEGKCVLSASVAGQHTVMNVSTLPTGAYFLQAGDKRGNVFKILKE